MIKVMNQEQIGNLLVVLKIVNELVVVEQRLVNETIVPTVLFKAQRGIANDNKALSYFDKTVSEAKLNENTK